MGVSEIGFPQNVVYKSRIQTSDTLPVTIAASKYCEFVFDIDAGDRMTPLGIVGWGCNDKTQVFLLDFYLDNDLQTAKLILKNPYATTIAINSLYIDVLYSKQGLDMSEVDVVDNLTTDSAIAALSAKQGKVLNEKIPTIKALVPNALQLSYDIQANGQWNRSLKTLIDEHMPSGYECLGIIGTTTNSVNVVAIAAVYTTSAYSLQLRNIGSTQQTGSVYVAYLMREI